MFENIDTSLIDWSRAQFALTAMYTGFSCLSLWDWL